LFLLIYYKRKYIKPPINTPAKELNWDLVKPLITTQFIRIIGEWRHMLRRGNQPTKNVGNLLRKMIGFIQ
jgi:hypothetical protein